MRKQKITKRYLFISLFIVMILWSVIPMADVKAEETQYFEESLAELDNPERGFYEPVCIQMQVSGNEIPDLHGNLIHLRVGISAFSGKANGTGDLPLTQDMLDALDGTLKNIKKNGGSVIIRFAYDDFDGIADLEPSMDMILKHISQLKSIFEDNADVITYVELGLFGPWGEMHTSSMCTTENVSMALDAMLEAVPEPITIGVRTPKYYTAWANVERDKLNLDMPQEGSKAYRVGLYNDGYLGSESDLGTFANREIEIAWLENQARHTFYGGEVVENRGEGEPLNTAAYLAEEAFRTHTTYLNRYWNNTVVDSWIDEIYQGEDTLYQGQSGYTYVVNHLGYRFVLRNCQLDEQIFKGQDLNLVMNIENVGFANLINEKKVSFVLQGENNTYEIETDIDATEWNSTEITTIQKAITLPENMELGEYKVFLRISKYGDYTSDNNYQCIELANDGIWNEEMGANQIGSIRVAEDEVTESEKGEITKPEKGEPTEPEESKPTVSGNSQPEKEPNVSGTEQSATTQDTNISVLVKEIKLTGISDKIAGGKKIQLKAQIIPQNANNQALKWTSSNKKYATVNQDGLVKVKKAGAGHSVTIKATSTDGSNETAKYKITIMKKAVQKLTVKTSKIEVKAGKQTKINVSVFPTKKVNSKLKYTSSNKKYATVNSKGVVKTKKAGKGKTVKIKVMTTDGSNLKKTVRIKIK